MLFSSANCFQDILDIFNKVLHTGLDLLMPTRRVPVNTSDAPWIMNDHLKSLILKRQKAFHDGGAESLLYKFYRNAVNRERKSCKASALNQNLAHIKNSSFGSINIVLISHVICHVTILLKIVNY